MMNTGGELHRLLRHVFGPLTVLMVERGWIPEAAQGDVTEAAIIVAGFAIPPVWSWLLDRLDLR